MRIKLFSQVDPEIAIAVWDVTWHVPAGIADTRTDVMNLAYAPAVIALIDELLDIVQRVKETSDAPH